eukprot:568385-Rhodomonas_salina.1
MRTASISVLFVPGVVVALFDPAVRPLTVGGRSLRAVARGEVNPKRRCPWCKKHGKGYDFAVRRWGMRTGSRERPSYTISVELKSGRKVVLTQGMVLLGARTQTTGSSKAPLSCSRLRPEPRYRDVPK